MATRLYLKQLTAASHSPAFDASWEVTGSAIRRILDTDKDETAFATAAATTASNTPAGAVDVLIAQFISAPLSANVTISGAIQGQVRASESNAAADMRMQCVIRVVQSDYSTVRGTLIASSAAALSNEFNTSLRNIKIPLGGSTVPTSVAALATDVIVVEIGYRKHENATNSRTGTFDLGAVSGGTDLAIDETTTTQNVPWIEFTEAITFSSTPRRISQAVVEGVVSPTSVQARLSQAVVEGVMAPTSQQARISQAVLEVIYPSSNPTTPPKAPAWGQIIG